MSVKITAILENTPDEKGLLETEHGLSFLIEGEGYRILFDTGKSDMFLRNAELLGISLEKIDAVVLSHGHYDHAGGFPALAESGGNFRLYLGKGFFRKKYSVRKNEVRYIGGSFAEDFLKEKGIDYTFVNDKKLEILPGVYLVSSFPRNHEDETNNPRFNLMIEGEYVVDDFSDEVAAVIEIEDGLTVVLGCSHPGMKNILDAVKERFDKPIRTVLGGSHLVEADDRRLEDSVNYLRAGELKTLGLCHCTGEKALRVLEMVPEYVPVHSGTVFILP